MVAVCCTFGALVVLLWLALARATPSQPEPSDWSVQPLSLVPLLCSGYGFGPKGSDTSATHPQQMTPHPNITRDPSPPDGSEPDA